MEQFSFTLRDIEYNVTRIGLRVWLELEETNKKIVDYMNGKSMLEASTSICSYLSIVTKLDVELLKTFFWLEIADAYVTILMASIPKISFPLLMDKTENRDPIVWDYEGRTGYKWAHILAAKYGWSMEYIADIYFEDGIALLQEVMIDEQMDKEWEWSLSELAYPYNKSIKKSEFKALPRPSWMLGMQKMAKEPEVARLPVSMIPQGLVMKWKQNEETIN